MKKNTHQSDIQRIAIGAAQAWAYMQPVGKEWCPVQFGTEVLKVYRAVMDSPLSAGTKPVLDVAPDNVGDGGGGTGTGGLGHGGDSGTVPANGAAGIAALDDDGGFQFALNTCITKVILRHRDKFSGCVLRTATGINHEDAFVVTGKINEAVLTALDLLYLDLLDSLHEVVAFQLRRLELLHGLDSGLLGFQQARTKV